MQKPICTTLFISLALTAPSYSQNASRLTGHVTCNAVPEAVNGSPIVDLPDKRVRKADLHRALLEIYLRKHDNEKVLAAFEELSKLTPNDAALHFNFAQFLEMLRDSRAAEEYSRAVTLDPQILKRKGYE